MKIKETVDGKIPGVLNASKEKNGTFNKGLMRMKGRTQRLPRREIEGKEKDSLKLGVRDMKGSFQREQRSIGKMQKNK